MRPVLIRTLRDDFHRTGYDREEEYFFHLNQALIAELHRQNEQRAARFARILALPAAKDSWFKRVLRKLVTPRPMGIYSFPI